MAAELNAYISFTLKRRLKLSSKPHEAIEGLLYLKTSLTSTESFAKANSHIRQNVHLLSDYYSCSDRLAPKRQQLRGDFNART